jgi:hypothetical protein
VKANSRVWQPVFTHAKMIRYFFTDAIVLQQENIYRDIFPSQICYDVYFIGEGIIE